MKMDAIIKPAAQPGLELVRKEVPVINDGEALVKVHYSAICGTDVHIYDWNQWAQDTIKPPMTIGHEFVGEIVEIKGNTSAFKVGDIVSAEGHVVCGKCRNCRAGRRHLCPNTKGIGVNRDGIFAEYASIPINNLWLTDKDIPEKMYAIFDPYGNATHTALKFPMIGEDVLITGAGPIGIMAAAIAKFAGARTVVITDVNEYRLELSRKMGVTRAVNVAKEDLKAIMAELGIKEGFDVGLEMSGAPSAFNQMLDNMIWGGKISMLGLFGKPIETDWNKVIMGGLTVQGIYGRKMYQTWYQMKNMVQGGLDISPIITHRFHYTEFEKGFEAMISGNSGKVVLDWTTKK